MSHVYRLNSCQRFLRYGTELPVFTHGTVTPHFFSPKTSLAFSYWFIGAILGHELTHGLMVWVSSMMGMEYRLSYLTLTRKTHTMI
jgi:hypothetical protein